MSKLMVTGNLVEKADTISIKEFVDKYVCTDFNEFKSGGKRRLELGILVRQVITGAELSNNQKYKENIGKVDIYYRQDVGNPKVIFKIDKNDNCSIEVIGVDSNFQNINKTYEFQFTRVEKELSDNIGIELEIPYTSKDTIRKSDNSIGIYGSENNKESTSIRMNIYQK